MRDAIRFFCICAGSALIWQNTNFQIGLGVFLVAANLFLGRED